MRYTKTSLGSNYASKQQIDTNLDDIKTAIDDTLSRKGDSPNAMEADLDMNSNDILNAGQVNTQTLNVNGANVTVTELTGVTLQKEEQTATAGQTVITLVGITYTPTANNMSLYINGVKQAASAYTETSTTVITLSEGMEVGDIIEVHVNQLLATVSGSLVMTDGITAPAAVVGQAILYVDSADGDLKVKFGDGTVKTIATDS